MSWQGVMIRSWLTAVLVVSAGAFAHGGEESIWSTDPEAAWQQASESQRPLLIFVTSDNCPHCHRMDRTTWQDRAVKRWLDDEFVALRVNADHHPGFVRQLRVRAFPTTLLVMPDRKIWGTSKGYVAPDKMEGWLATAAEQATHSITSRASY